jgi:5-formyltetrahydrofolate cyclo-ligase
MKRKDSIKNLNKSKKYIRKSIMALRDSMPKNLIEVKSIKIAEKFFELQKYKKSNSILAYYPFKSELDTRIIIKKSMSRGKKIALPRVNKKNLEIYYIKNLPEDLRTGIYGLIEPLPSTCEKASIEDMDLVIVPGVGFDPDLNRIGYGGGFYDRLLRNVSDKLPKIALALDIQVIDHIPVSEHDIKVDIIITESFIYDKKTGKNKWKDIEI